MTYPLGEWSYRRLEEVQEFQRRLSACCQAPPCQGVTIALKRGKPAADVDERLEAGGRRRHHHFCRGEAAWNGLHRSRSLLSSSLVSV